MRSLAAIVLLLLPTAARADDLETSIAPLAKAHRGTVAVAVKHLTTGEEFYLNADEPLPTASLIKLPIMVETYAQVAEGKVKFETTLTLRKEDKVGGSGILTQHFSGGSTFALRDAVRLMIAYSDNTATNLVLDQISLPATNARMEKFGLKNTKVNAKVFRADTRLDQAFGKKFGLGSTTAREMVTLLELIHSEKVVSPAACKEMIAHLKTCEDKDKITRLLPAGTVVAHKTGSVNASKTDAGILYLKSGPVALCVLTDKNADERWTADNEGQVTIARIARAVYDHFAPVGKK